MDQFVKNLPIGLRGGAVIVASLYVLGPSVALVVAVAVYVIEQGPVIGMRWLSFLRDLRGFRKGK